ncbi:MAG: nucleotidyltransferase family protein [Thermoleophilaceae bacterium]
MTVLHDLAQELHVSERTLRRAVAEGTIRAERPSVRRLRLTEEEREWVLRHWPTVARLRGELRTEPSVRLAVLFGSGARGREHPRSDLDLVVELDGPSTARLAGLEERLSRAAGRAVQLVPIHAAQDAPGLLADALRDGRVLVDRDAVWRRLKGREAQVRRAAEARDEELLEQALRPLEASR